MDHQVTSPETNQSGKVVHTSKKQIIINLYKDILITDPNINYEDLLKQLSTKSKIGVELIKNIIKKYKRTKRAPVKKRQTKVYKVEDFSMDAIRQKIHAFWFRREIPTSKKLIKAIHHDPDLPNLNRMKVENVLKTMQIDTKRYMNNILTEREYLVTWRRQYISDIRRYRQEGRTIYFLDEMWVNAEDCTSKVCVDQTLQSRREKSRNPTGKDKQLIVVHIGSVEGFVKGGLMCFKSQKNISDYHKELNDNSFFEWFCGILPSLKDNSVIVLDNAPYHSVKTEQLPTTDWKKADIIQWLESKGIEITEPMIKFELLRKVRELKQKYDLYVVDEEAKKQNKIVLRLPPNHCILNPIELAWSVVKGHVKENNTTYKNNDFQQLLNDCIQKVIPEMWSNFISRTVKEEDKLWQLDFITDEMLEEKQKSTSGVNNNGINNDIIC